MNRVLTRPACHRPSPLPEDVLRELESCSIALWLDPGAPRDPGGDTPPTVPVAVSVMRDGSGVSFLAPGDGRTLSILVRRFSTLLFSARSGAFTATLGIRVLQASICAPEPDRHDESCFLIVAGIDDARLRWGDTSPARAS